MDNHEAPFKGINYLDVSLEQLWSIIGGGTKFTLDEILVQASTSLTDGEPFFLQHHDRLYRVSVESIDAYFQVHPIPEKRMTVEEQNKVLLDRNKRLEEEIAMLKAGKGGPSPHDSGPRERSSETPDPGDISPDGDEPIEAESLLGETSSPRPIDNPTKPMSAAELRKDLAASLAGKKPDVKNRP